MAFLTWLSTYLIIILCEMGDKTQLAVLMFSTNNPGKRWLIYGASALALTLCVIVEVTLGVTLRKYIGPGLFNRATGVIFLFIGLYILSQSIISLKKSNRAQLDQNCEQRSDRIKKLQIKTN